MPKNKVRTIKVFIASPSDLSVERAAFKDVIEELNNGFGDGAGVEFEGLGWEDTLSQVGRRPQDEINKDVDKCDAFILTMWRRWGEKDPGIPKPATSRTEEEYLRAFERWEKTASPRIFVFFKKIDSAFLSDPGPQLKKVLAFKRKLEKSGRVLYRTFDDDAGFRRESDRHLREFARDEEAPAVPSLQPVDLPEDRVQELEKALAEAEQRRQNAEKELARLKSRKDSHRDSKKPARKALENLSYAKAEELGLILAERAANAALEGRVEEARQDFAKAATGTTNLRVLLLAYEFYERIGDLRTAEEMLERWLAISGRESETVDTAVALGNLGNIYETRGDLDRAEEIYSKSLDLSRKLKHMEGMAKQYINLGVVYNGRGDLDQAEKMYRKSLDLHEKLGDQKGMAILYGNLGIVYETRGDPDESEKMYIKALEINERLGLQLGMASQFRNLGDIYHARGKLDEAEKMYRKSIDINKKLERTRGLAVDYANLGSNYKKRGDVVNAKKYWTMSRDLYQKIGMLPKLETVQRWLSDLDADGHQTIDKNAEE